MKGLDPRKTARIAAGMAISNMGQCVPERITDTKYGWSHRVDDAVVGLAEQFMETYEHERIFVKEARGWAKTIRQTSREEILRLYGKHLPWIETILDMELAPA